MPRCRVKPQEYTYEVWDGTFPHDKLTKYAGGYGWVKMQNFGGLVEKGDYLVYNNCGELVEILKQDTFEDKYDLLDAEVKLGHIG